MYFGFVLCLAIGIAFFLWMAANDALSLNKSPFETSVSLPVEKFSTKDMTVENADGTYEKRTVSSVDREYLLNTLKAAGLIQYKWLFSFYCNLSNAYSKVDPGEYTLKSSYDYRALVQNMRKGVGGMKTVDVTIPEGFTMLDIFRRFDENDVASFDSLMEAAETGIFQYDFLEGTEDYGPSRLEGYLFPDTYQFYVGTESSTAINKLLNVFNTKYSEDLISQTHDMGFSVKDMVTIASIIEKEAKYDEDRAYVASVIYNRLNAGMSLGMDTTILYLFPEHEGEPTQDMLDTDSPYNTHMYTGFPPTPICNPGMASVNAALNPADSDYYYFYADIETGKLNFFTNYDEFDSYVQSHRNQAS